MTTPLMYRDFGEDMVTIQVGQAPTIREFKVHKNLISRSSDFFRSAFEGFFIESSQQKLKLPEEYPDVFEAFCDWLYSGEIHEEILYTNNETPSDLFWLRIYTMADRHNISALQDLASDNIIKFNQPESIPSTAFVAELFETLMPNKYLEHYVVRHVAAKLTSPHIDWKLWARVLKANDRFGAAVAVRVAKINSKNYNKCKDTPQKDPKFNQERYDEVDTDPDNKEEHEGRPSFIIRLDMSRLDRRNPYLEVTAAMKVAELKENIWRLFGVTVPNQTLYAESKLLRDGLSLHEYNIQKNSKIVVTRGLL